MNVSQNLTTLRALTLLLAICSVTLIAIACASDPPTPTPTPVPPTATPVPPTPTPVPPTATPQPTATPEPDYSAYADVPGIVDPTNFGWPRELESSEGRITLTEPPAVAHFASLGHAEIAFGLIDPSRVAAAYSFFADPEGSNIAELVGGVPMIGFEPEEVVALEPDVIVLSKFTNPDLVAVFIEAEIPVLRTALAGNSGDIPNILLMAYLLGAEDRGIELASEVGARLEAVQERVHHATSEERALTTVLALSEYGDIWAAGAGSNVDSIIKDAGGSNAAAEIDNFQQISIESVAAMNPDMIVITQPMESGLMFAEKLKESPVLQDVGAILNDQVHVVATRHFTTLSHWNVRGVETLAKMLYPEEFADVEFEDFKPFDSE